MSLILIEGPDNSTNVALATQLAKSVRGCYAKRPNSSLEHKILELCQECNDKLLLETLLLAAEIQHYQQYRPKASQITIQSQSYVIRQLVAKYMGNNSGPLSFNLPRPDRVVIVLPNKNTLNDDKHDLYDAYSEFMYDTGCALLLAKYVDIDKILIVDTEHTDSIQRILSVL